MDHPKIPPKFRLVLALCSIIFVALACTTFIRPTPSPTARPSATPDFHRTAEYQAALATQLSATQVALQASQIKPTLEAIYHDFCTLPIVQAEGDSILQDLTIDLWPEYDRPSMLVIYRITLSSWTVLPVDLVFRIPARVGEPNAVAVQGTDGAMYNASYTRTTEGDWAMIQFSTTAPIAQLEYYDPALERSAAARHYEFQWLSEYSITNLLVRVQVPLQVKSLQIVPEMVGPGLSYEGSLYMCRRMELINSDTLLSFTIDYEMSGP